MEWLNLKVQKDKEITELEHQHSVEILNQRERFLEQKEQNMRDYFEMMWAMVDLYEERKTWLHVKYKGFKPDETVYNTVKLIIGDPDRWSPAHVNRVLFWLGGKLNDTNV